MDPWARAGAVALVVHEEPEVVTTWAHRLESTGYTVLTAGRDEAVDLALERRPSLVLLDDLDVLGRLRGHEETARVPVVVLPARTSEAREGALPVAAAVDILAERDLGDARFRAVVEAAPDAMVIVGEDGRIVLVNQQTLRAFGYSREELIGRPMELLVPERFRDDHRGHRVRYRENPRVGPIGVGQDLTGLRKDGTEFPMEIALSPVDTGHGGTTAASIRDVTERRHAEEARAMAFEREREATSRLREVDRLRSDFLSTVSHELRTPLTAIKGFAEYLVNMWDTMPDERRRDMVYRILHAGGRLDFLIEDLLDFSRLERGQFQVEVQPHQLSAVVRETLRHLGSSMERHQVDLELDDAAWVMADRSALMRVVENLLTNAAKFSPHGSAIEVRGERRGDQVVLSVRDEGVGIPEEEHEKVFDRFYRVPDTAAKYPGTGIGLAIVKQFAEAQGGEVTLSSLAGEGSEFQLRLRPAPAPTPAPA